MVIQILVVTFALFALSRVFARFRSRLITLVEFMTWSGFWAAVAVLVLVPKLSQWFAKLLGVGRGADAVFYTAIVVLFYLFFRIYSKIRAQEYQITLLVRKLALERSRNGKSLNATHPTTGTPKDDGPL